MRRFLDARAERAAGRARAQRPVTAGAACLYGVPCRCCCSFFLGLSPDLEAEEKMWWGRGEGFRVRDAKPRRSAEAG